MKKLLVILYLWFKLNFGYCGNADNKINNYYAGIPYVAEMAVNEDDSLDLSLE